MMNINRRRLLQMFGIVGVGAITTPWARLVYGQPENPIAHAATMNAGKKRQWTMVVDLRMCDGCGDCTEACIKEHFVPEGQKWIEVFKDKTLGEGSFFLPAPCMQCENAPCVKVCPVGASYYNEEGVVLIDHRKCIGCRFCIAACPYHRRFFNWGQPKVPPEAHFAQYSPEYPVPAVKGTVIKCMFCSHNALTGKLPACVQGCPMKAIYFGDHQEGVVTNGVELKELDHMLAENNAQRYQEELGTKPRVYYIPGYGQKVGRDAL